jgi:uncharacterized protein YbaR (Trm112 family)
VNKIDVVTSTIWPEFLCPLTHQPLNATSLEAARLRIAAGQPLATRQRGAHQPAPVGETAKVMLRSDGRAAYPILDGVPILLGPEILSAPGSEPLFDLVNSHYAEAYNETPFYDAEAATKENLIGTSILTDLPYDGLRRLGSLHALPAQELTGFPNPPLRWLTSRMDAGSEWDCYTHLAPVEGKIIAQIGGTGEVAMTMLLAGAAAALLVTPILGEAKLARKLAGRLGLAEQFACVVAVAEEIPSPDASFDLAFSGGSVHHMTTELAFPEIARVLRSGGKFAAIEPWRAPLYALGTKIFGKREANPFCRPLTRERVAPLFKAFARAAYVQHGALTRYPMLAMQQLGARISRETAWTIGRADDRLCSLIPLLKRFGSGVALLATK